MKRISYSAAAILQVISVKGPWWLSFPRGGRMFSSGDYAVALGVAVFALNVYLVTLGPTITGEDSGEFVVAARILGIPHPPGYPLYCLLAHCFTWLPFGEVAWRVNLMSAVFAACAAAMTALTVVYLTRNRFAALGAGVALACSREFWAQAVIAEVYALNAFWFILCLLLLLRWTDTRKNSALFVLALLFGLGMTVHNTFVLLIPPFVVYVLLQDMRHGALYKKRILTYTGLAILAAFGMLVYAYLPIRSRTDPPLEWGNPENLTNFYHVVRRSQYEFMLHQYPRSVARFWGQLAVYGRFWLGEFTPWGAVVGAFGLILLTRKRPGYASLLVVASLLILAGFSLWQNFELTREWLWVMRVFAIPVYMVTAIGIGVFLEALWRRRPAATIVVAALCAAPSLYMHWERNDKSDYYWTLDYGVNILRTLPPDALYVSESDHGSFSVLYLQTVFGMRPDIENLRKYGYLQSTLFEEMPAPMRKRIGEFPKRRYDPEILVWLMEHTDRPLYLAKPMALPGARMAPAGLLFRALRPGEQPSGRDYWAGYQWRAISPEETRGDYTAEVILYEMHKARAYAALIEARKASPEEQTRLEQKALEHLELGLSVYGRDPMILNNAGVLCARYGFYQQAQHYFLEALRCLPHLSEAQRNRERVLRRLNPES